LTFDPVALGCVAKFVFLCIAHIAGLQESWKSLLDKYATLCTLSTFYDGPQFNGIDATLAIL